MIAVEITALIVGDPDNQGGNVGIIDPVFLIVVVPIIILAAIHPARGQLFRFRFGGKPASTAIALLSAIPLSIYAVDQALRQRNSWPPAADPHHNGHWQGMAMMAFAIALIGLFASLKSTDLRIPAWSAGLAALSFGLGSILMPELASSAGRLWGAVILVGGILFLGVVHWEASHTQTSRRSARIWQSTKQ